MWEEINILYSADDKKRYSNKEYKKFYNLEDFKDPRDEYYRDYCRIIHSPSFRRLQCKCQLFPIGESDFFRNRLTHSLEVAQIGKVIASFLNKKPEFIEHEKKCHEKINIEIVEIAGLAHDLGHPPFGHQGEKALDDCMAEYGGFEGNAQTLRILAKIEKKEKKGENPDDLGIENGKDERHGLNLTYRSLASILKYDKLIPLTRNKKLSKKIFKNHFEKVITEEIKKEYENKLKNEKLKKKIDTEIKKANSLIDVENIEKTLKKNGVIYDEGYLCEPCLEELKKTKLSNGLEKYKLKIISALKNWDDGIIKRGYYKSEEELVKKIKKNIIKNEKQKDFETIECQIMDIADDIAYSTYDFEDALKGNFISLYDCLAPKEEVVEYMYKNLNKCGKLVRTDYKDEDVKNIFMRIFNEPLSLDDFKESYQKIDGKEVPPLVSSLLFYERANTFQYNGYERVRLTSSLIARFVTGVYIEECSFNPLMSINLKEEIREEVEVLKNFVYKSIISSNLIKIPAYRGYEIIKTIFNVLKNPEGNLLLPDDYREIYKKLEKEDKTRLICDFIAGMTDRYVLEFYGRLISENPQSIYKPIS